MRDTDDLSIEVYTPRDWIQEELWKQTLKDEIMHIDTDADFVISISTGPSTFEPYSPWDLDDAIALTGPSVRTSLVADGREALSDRRSLDRSYLHAGGALTT